MCTSSEEKNVSLGRAVFKTFHLCLKKLVITEKGRCFEQPCLLYSESVDSVHVCLHYFIAGTIRLLPIEILFGRDVAPVSALCIVSSSYCLLVLYAFCCGLVPRFKLIYFRLENRVHFYII